MKQTIPLFDHLKLLESKLLEPGIRKSEEALSELIHDDFIEYGSSGKIYDKSLVISFLKNTQGEKFSVENFYVQQLSDDVALVTYNALKEKNDGTKISSLRSSIWRLNNEKWQIIFHQGTLLNKI